MLLFKLNQIFFEHFFNAFFSKPPKIKVNM